MWRRFLAFIDVLAAALVLRKAPVASRHTHSLLLSKITIHHAQVNIDFFVLKINEITKSIMLHSLKQHFERDGRLQANAYPEMIFAGLQLFCAAPCIMIVILQL
jgi:hypothetical protein